MEDIRWTPETKHALAKLMDPGGQEPLVDLHGKFSKTSARERFEPDSDGAYISLTGFWRVPFSEPEERERFWSHWRDALGDIASMYDDETVLQAIEMLMELHKPYLDVDQDDLDTGFDIRQLAFLNPRFGLDTDGFSSPISETLPPLVAPRVGKYWNTKYKKTDALSVFFLFNPTASDLALSYGEEFFDHFKSYEFERLVTMIASGALGMEVFHHDPDEILTLLMEASKGKDFIGLYLFFEYLKNHFHDDPDDIGRNSRYLGYDSDYFKNQRKAAKSIIGEISGIKKVSEWWPDSFDTSGWYSFFAYFPFREIFDNMLYDSSARGLELASLYVRFARQLVAAFGGAPYTSMFSAIL